MADGGGDVPAVAQLVDEAAAKDGHQQGGGNAVTGDVVDAENDLPFRPGA